ncbi:MAG TPA: SsrA-binding protein SmpB [Thermoanaerobacterales bacterium]|nr:SsrA-binding protein SmpB [Thermoanaerobacterales bacterium]
MRQIKNLITNRKARHDYHIEETFEAGIVLTGTEVKSLRDGRGNLKDSYAMIRNGELFLHNMHISAYDPGNRFNHDPTRTRKLLMHKREILRLHGFVKTRGYAIVPLRVYVNERGFVKIEIALAKGKKLYDKRHDIAKRDAERELRRAFKDSIIK